MMSSQLGELGEGPAASRAGRGEQLWGLIWPGVARLRRTARAVREALPGKEVGRVGAARDLNDAVLILCQQV